jgi:hypothetical protein
LKDRGRGGPNPSTSRATSRVWSGPSASMCAAVRTSEALPPPVMGVLSQRPGERRVGRTPANFCPAPLV